MFLRAENEIVVADLNMSETSLLQRFMVSTDLGAALTLVLRSVKFPKHLT